MSTLLSLVQQHYDTLGRGDLDDAVELFDPAVETMTPNGILKGLDEFRALGETFRTAMSDMHHEIVRSYERINDALMPVLLESTAQLRFLGRSALRMTYEYSAIDDQPIAARLDSD